MGFAVMAASPADMAARLTRRARQSGSRRLSRAHEQSPGLRHTHDHDHQQKWGKTHARGG